MIAAKQRRVCDLHKAGSEQCAVRRRGIFNEQIEVAERTVGWDRIVGGDLRTLHEHEVAPIRAPDLAKNATREHRAHCSGAFVRHEIDWNLASTRSPEPGSCEVQTMLPQRLEARRSVDESFDYAGKPDVIVGARPSMRSGWAMQELARRGGRRRSGLHTHLTHAQAANFRTILGINAVLVAKERMDGERCCRSDRRQRAACARARITRTA